MDIVSEDVARRVVSIVTAIEAVEATFRSLASRTASNYPVVREAIGHADAVFGVKTGYDRALGALGLKAGGYWPHNASGGKANHQSATVMFDPQSGAAEAVVSANHLTGLRTAAASALSIRALARRDATVLGIVGAGGQALHQLRAALAVHAFERVVVWSRDPTRVMTFIDGAAEFAMVEPLISAEAVARTADVLITLTPSRAPLIERDWIRPGTHICAVGSDTIGKQELATDLVMEASIYADVVEQSLTIGEGQHPRRIGSFNGDSYAGTLGAALLAAPERAAAEITIFDSTGMALQDLCVARLALDEARRQGLVASVAY